MSGLYSKFVIKEKKDDVVHSSGYGVAQSGGAMGASSGVGFTERMRINNNRTKIRRYGDSKIANQFQVSRSRAAVYDKSLGDSKGIGTGGRDVKGDYSGRLSGGQKAGGMAGNAGAGNGQRIGGMAGGATGGRSIGGVNRYNSNRFMK